MQESSAWRAQADADLCTRSGRAMRALRNEQAHTFSAAAATAAHPAPLPLTSPSAGMAEASVERRVLEALQSYVLFLCSAIAACSRLQSVLQLLANAAAALLEGSNAAQQEGEEAAGEQKEGHEELEARRQALLAAAAAQSGEPPAPLIRRLLYTSPAFQDLSETLLTGVVSGSQGGDPGSERCQLSACTFLSWPSTPSLLAPIDPPLLQSWRPTGCHGSRSSSGSACLPPGSTPPLPPRSCWPLPGAVFDAAELYSCVAT